MERITRLIYSSCTFLNRNLLIFPQPSFVQRIENTQFSAYSNAVRMTVRGKSKTFRDQDTLSSLALLAITFLFVYLSHTLSVSVPTGFKS